MEENMFNSFLEGYVNIHNELVDLDVSDKKSEIERLEKIIEANDMLIQNYTKEEDIDLNDREKRKKFESDTKQYMENIKNAEKQKEEIRKQQEENINKKEQLEKAQKGIRERAKQMKEKRLTEEKQKEENNSLKKQYDDCAVRKSEIETQLEEFKNIDLETTQQEVKRIQLDNELRNIQAKMKSISQDINQESSMSKKVQKDYILFLGQLSLVDNNKEKVIKQQEETQTEVGKSKEDKLLEEMVAGREKREEERYNEMIKDALEQEKLKKEKEEQDLSESSDTKSNIVFDEVKQEFDEANKDYSKVHLKAGKEVGKANVEILDRVTYIEISEKDGTVSWYNNKEELEVAEVKEAFKGKKDKFKKLDIYKKCKEITGNPISAFLLKRELNPEIVMALDNYSDQLKKYISSIYHKTELPFELKHNLSGMKLLDKIQRNKFAKLERKLGATVLGKLFDKNEALNEAKDATIKKEEKEEKVKPIDEYRNVIDKKAQAKNVENILKEQEERRAEEVQNMKEDNVEKVSGDAVLDKEDKVVAELQGTEER